MKTLPIAVRKNPIFLFSSVFLFSLAFSLFWMPGSAWARFHVTPKISASETYNDNIFLDPGKYEDGDWITVIEPGLLFSWDTANLKVDLDYSLQFRYFSDNSYLNETSFEDVQRGKLTATLFPRENFTVLAQGDISRVVVDESDRTSDENEFINRATLYHFFINPTYRLRLTSTLAAILGYRFELATYAQVEHAKEYDYEEPNDYNQHIVSLVLEDKFTPRTLLTAGYFFTDYHAEENDPGEINEDFTRHDAVLGIEQKVGSRLTLKAQGGLAYFDFDESGNENGRTWDLGLHYEASKSLTLETVYTYNYVPSVSQGFSKVEDWSGFIRYHRRLSADLHVYYTKTTYAEDGIDNKAEYTEDKATGASLTFSYPLSRHITAKLNTDYTYWKFKPENEKVDRYGIGPSLDYSFRKFNVGLSYYYRVNNSDINENDYRNNIGMLEVSWEL
jgi:hypothetical protein